MTLQKVARELEEGRIFVIAMHVLMALWIAAGIVAAVVLFVLDYQRGVPRWPADIFAAAAVLLSMALYRLKDW